MLPQEEADTELIAICLPGSRVRHTRIKKCRAPSLNCLPARPRSGILPAIALKLLNPRRLVTFESILHHRQTMRARQTTRSTQKWLEKADRQPANIKKSFGEIVRQLRHKAGMTIEELALASKISRAMLSSVERGEKSPTLSVLTGIASGLNVPISRLMAEVTPSSVASVVRRPERMIFHDQETGIERHLLSPSHLDTGIELVEHVLPPGQRFAGTPRIGMRMDKYVVVIEGALTVEMQDASYNLDTADSMYFRINGEYCFVNNSRRPCRYYLFIVHRRE